METMDHSEVREILEDAAIEPGGLERLMAGDTPAAAIVAGHLAGCPDCAEELELLRRSVGLIRPTVRAVPPPELRERTLAYVAAIGRPRDAAVAAIPAAEAIGRAAVEPAPLPPVARRANVRRPRLFVLTGLAAALIVAVSGTALVVSNERNATINLQTAEIEALGDVARWTLRVDAQPDVRRVVLASVDSTATTDGQIVFSPASTELVVVADGLRPSAGHEYRCWVEVGGKRTPMGKMFFGGDLAYWVGTVPAVAGIPANASFGVSLLDLGAVDAPGQPVLAGIG